MKNKLLIMTIIILIVLSIIALTVCVGFNSKKEETNTISNNSETISYNPQEIVNKYVETFNNLDSSKLESITDYRGVYAMEEGYNDLSKFEELYNSVDENSDKVKAYAEDMKYFFSQTIGFIKDNYESYNIELLGVEDKGENKYCKDIKEVEAKFKISYKLKDQEEIENIQNIKFSIYKGKLVDFQ